MARGANGRFCGRGITSSPGVRRFRAQIRESQKQGDGGSIGKVADAGNRKLVVRGGQIEQGGDYVVVRGHRIERVGLRINSQGEVYVPDSEEEDDMEMEDVAVGLAANGAPGMEVAADGAPGMEVAVDRAPGMEVATDGASGMEVSADRTPGLEVAADGAPGVEFAPEVQARLDAVLAGIDPLYHDVYISLYKACH
ncbi:unnamed protein product [Urochloa decumbens]|uniref:Uncharacterized protein n=1 Tax=Urochloa decumbens TaxID=240449 RepID=A0ABC8WS57_9POAL